MVLGWLEQEQDAVKELDATEGCDSHVQEDAEEHSQGNAGQDRFHEDGQSCEDGHTLSSGHPGISTNGALLKLGTEHETTVPCDPFLQQLFMGSEGNNLEGYLSKESNSSLPYTHSPSLGGAVAVLRGTRASLHSRMPPLFFTERGRSSEKERRNCRL